MNGEFAHFIKTDELMFKHAKGMRNFVGKEFHTFHEIFLFIAGEAELTSDTMQEKLKPYSLVLIPRGRFHQFTVADNAEYERCVFNFGSVRELDLLIEKKLSEVRVIPFTLGKEQFARLFEAARENPDGLESKVLAKAVLAELLCSAGNGQTDENNSSLHPLIKNAVHYIDRHLSDGILIDDIAQYLHISPSYLYRIFREKMHISVYKYITEKRLVNAARLIKSGVPATKAAEISGFTDYSSFYRLYRSGFGISPSETLKNWGEYD